VRYASAGREILPRSICKRTAASAIAELHRDPIGVGDDVGIGKHLSVLGIHDHTRPEALDLTPERLISETEREPEKRIGKERDSALWEHPSVATFTTAGDTRSSIVPGSAIPVYRRTKEARLLDCSKITRKRPSRVSAPNS